MSKGKVRKIEVTPGSRAARATTSGKPKSVQEILAELPGEANYDLAISMIPEIPQSAAFCAAIASYLEGNRPPHLEWERDHGLAFEYQEVVAAARNLAHWIAQLKLRGMRTQGLEMERQYKKAQKEWRRKQQKLIKLLEDAGDLFESGQIAGGYGFKLKEYLNAEMPQSLSERIAPKRATNYAKERKARIKNRIHSLAEIVSTTPVGAVFPVAQPPADLLILEDVGGESGRRTTNENSLRAAAMNMFYKLVPASLSQRDSVVANLTALAGYSPGPNPRQLARSLRKRQEEKANKPPK